MDVLDILFAEVRISLEAFVRSLNQVSAKLKASSVANLAEFLYISSREGGVLASCMWPMVVKFSSNKT